MTWFSRGIPFVIGQSRRKWNILNSSIKTWVANLSIGDEDNFCQRSSFYYSVSIEPGSLLCSPPRDFKQYWIWPSLRSERKSSKRVRFESDWFTDWHDQIEKITIVFFQWENRWRTFSKWSSTETLNNFRKCYIVPYRMKYLGMWYLWLEIHFPFARSRFDWQNHIIPQRWHY